MTRHEWHNFWTGMFFVSPWLIGLTVFTLLPTGMAFYFSLTDYSILNPPAWVGMQNYGDLVADEVFWKALWNTVYFAGLSLPLGTVLAIVLALVLNARVVARPVFRTIFFLPSLVPLVAFAILWQWMLNAQYGIVNNVLGLIGIEGPNWLGDVRWSKPALVLSSMWGVGNAVIIYLAGLQDIPRTLYESAEIDGAGTMSKIRHITLPMLSPVIYFNLIMGTITVMQEFIRPYVMLGSEGQPGRSTLLYAMYLFNQAFRHLNMGYACAMAVILFAMIALLTWCIHKLSAGHVHYGG